jgi:small multidrug resistance pump
MGYLYLSISIIAEVIGTTALKASEEFTNPVPSIIVIVSYAVAFYSLTFVLRTIPVGVAYAIWSGVGIALISVAAFFMYRQSLDLPAIIGIGLIMAGVAVINLYSKSVLHG